MAVCRTGFGLAAPPAAPDDVVPAGFQPHVRPARGGRIDWARGVIIAEGKGVARGKTDQDRLMAKRAGKVVAARNALLVANGIQVDADGRFAAIRNGQVRVSGILRDLQTVSVTWQPNRDPPECIVGIHVPIWGAKGLASVAHAAQRRKAMARAGGRLVLVAAEVDVSDEILVIDARGVTTEPCLYPVVVDSTGQVLYDVETMTNAGGGPRPPVRYVETSLTYEELSAAPPRASGPGSQGRFARISTHLWHGPSAWGGHRRDAGATAFRDSLFFVRTQDRSAARDGIHGLLHAGGHGPLLLAQPPAKPTSRSTSQPTSRPTRRRRRVVRAVKTGPRHKTEIVLTRQDAEKLRKDPKGASLLRQGRVIVVVDSAAAGIQGRRPDRNDTTRLAARLPR